MAVKHASSGEIIDLAPLQNRLANARTKALVKAGSFEAVRLIVHKDSEIAPHQVAGAITLHCLEGRVLVGLDRGDLDLAAGQWLYLEGSVRHSLRGIEDSSLLLTIVF